MWRIKRNPEKYELVRIGDSFARSLGLDLRDPGWHRSFLTDIAARLEDLRRNAALVHGQRVESMFAYVAGALGGCRIVKEEDAGNLYVETTMRPPDFRLVTTTGKQLLIEVKSVRHGHPQRRYRLRASDVSGLLEYARSFDCPLLFALYWSRARKWTLLAPDDFSFDGRKYTITMLQAVTRNRMYLLNDRALATLPSLRLKLISDAQDRRINSHGRAEFRVSRAELYCADVHIHDPFEQQLAWFLMLNGEWASSADEPEIVDGELISITFRVEPVERVNADHPFEIIGHLGDLISRQFTDVTAPDGEVRRLTPEAEPSAFGILIPPDYKGKALKLWRFELHPRNTSEAA